MISKTPATCTNVALHNLYPGEIDLVVCMTTASVPIVFDYHPRADFWTKLW